MTSDFMECVFCGETRAWLFMSRHQESSYVFCDTCGARGPRGTEAEARAGWENLLAQIDCLEEFLPFLAEHGMVELGEKGESDE